MAHSNMLVSKKNGVMTRRQKLRKQIERFHNVGISHVGPLSGNEDLEGKKLVLEDADDLYGQLEGELEGDDEMEEDTDDDISQLESSMEEQVLLLPSSFTQSERVK